MLPCPSCDRHVYGQERACPFCASPLRSTRGPWNGAAAVVVAVGSMLFACGPAISDAGDTIDTEPGSTSSQSTGEEGTTGVGTTTAAAVTTDPTDPTMAMTSSSSSVGETTTGGSTTWDDDTSDSCGGFYGGCPVDVGDGPDLSYECDLFMQDCPDGEKCMPWANDGGSVWNASRCTPLDPAPGSPGDPCVVEGSGVSGIDSCALGVMCFDVDPETNEGVCTQMCGGSADAPSCAEDTCVVQFAPAVPLCLPVCDPDAPTCEKTEVCAPVDDPALDVHACTPG